MGWKSKAVLQRSLSAMPGGYTLNYLLQRYVTHGLPPPDTVIREHFELSRRYLDLFAQHSQTSVSDARFYEFGAGAALNGPLSRYALGVDSQLIVDIRMLARRELVEHAVESLRRLASDLKPVREPPPLTTPGGSWVRGLRDLYGIEYVAPQDARSTPLETAIFDCATSTNTLEHIPPDDIHLILAETRRLLPPGGLMICQIDYTDHYSYFDDSISAYNFLQYSDEAWKRFSPSLQYQNRLRHSDHVRLIRESGFAILEDHPVRGSADDLQVIAGLPVDSKFREYEPADLAITGSIIVAQPEK